MYEQEKKRSREHVVLIGFTVMAFALGVWIFLMGWYRGNLIRLALEVAFCWAVHFSRKFPQNWENWLVFLLAMQGYVDYGIHETSVYALAPVMIGIIALYFAVELSGMIRLCVLFYFGVLAADLFVVFRKSFVFTPVSVTNLVISSVFVCLAAYLAQRMIDERKDEAADTRAHIARLEEENRRTENFLTNVSHELRTPINAVTGLTAVMLKHEEDREKREDLFSIQKAGYRLFGQIEDILDYTEIDTGRMMASEDSYMLSSIINDIITEMQMTGDRGITDIIFDVDPRIPVQLYGDGKKIKKIIKHLVDNGVKFTEEGGVCVHIYALPKSYGLNLCIRVKDTGIGMDAESLLKITERFYQSSSGRSRRTGGLGLGLPIVYGMAAAMEGFVHVESEVGKGTTVTVSIPQKILDDTPGMQVNNPKELCLACYLMPEKYKVPEVRKFYDEMIQNLARGLGISVHRAFVRGDLEALISTYRLTHIFLAREEYEQDPDYFENLDPRIIVVLVADSRYEPRQGSRVRILRKPFFGFPVVGILNSAADEEPVRSGCRLVCPGVKVLVVDDEPMNRMVAEGILRDYQMTVKTAESGQQALEIYGQEDFDLILLDHMMPGMDGVETLKQLQKVKQESELCTVVAFTANAVSGAREMFLREGFDDFLSKPVESTELERVLRKVLPKSRIQFLEEKETVPPQDGEKTGQKELLEAAEIHIASGLAYCRNDREFYLQMLEKFASDAAGKAEELDRAFAAKDINDYRIHVHALKSSAKMMGADRLSEMAKELEDAAKQDDRTFLEEHHGALLATYRETARRVADAVGEQDGQEEESPAEGTPICREELAEALKELNRSFETYEADVAQNLIAELDGTVCDGKPVRRLLEAVRRDVDNFEYEAAAEKTADLIRNVEGGGTL